jgi:ADP-heptose:LPS heptosyltransferase
MKFLVIRLHSLPHIAAAIHVVKCIKHTYPNAEIQFVTSKEFAHYVSQFYEVNKVHVVQGDIAPVVFELLAQKFTHLVDLQCNARTFYIRTYLNQQYNSNLIICKYKQGFAAALRKKDNDLVPSLTSKMLAACTAIKLQALAINWYYPIDEQSLLAKEDIPTSHSLGYYCIELNGNTKDVQLLDIIKAIKMPVILTGTKDDSTLAEKIKEFDHFKIYNAAGKFSNQENAQLYASSHLNFVSTSIGLVLATAANKPILAYTSVGATVADTAPAAANKITSLKSSASTQDVINAITGNLYR